jgi:CheY-like chemotaxis protein
VKTHGHEKAATAVGAEWIGVTQFSRYSSGMDNSYRPIDSRRYYRLSQNFGGGFNMALKVLTVDDSKTIRMIVKKSFRPFDVEVMEAENGVEGLKAAKEQKPDLIILDITMPVMNGIEMLSKLKEEDELKSIPVIMLTAESGKDNVMQIVKMGVKNYIVKPFKGEQLIERTKTVLTLETRPDKPAVDPAAKYFAIDGDVQIMSLPPKLARSVVVEIEGALLTKIKEMGKAGLSKLILDLSKLSEVNMNLIKLIVTTIQNTSKSKIYTRFVGSPAISSELKNFAETSDITVYVDREEAKAAF